MSSFNNRHLGKTIEMLEFLIVVYRDADHHRHLREIDCSLAAVCGLLAAYSHGAACGCRSQMLKTRLAGRVNYQYISLEVYANH